MRLFDLDPVVRFFWEGVNPPGWIEPERRIFDTLLVYLSRGSFRLRIDAREHVLQAGHIVLLPPGLAHESWTTEDDTAARHCIHFDWTREFAALASPLQVSVAEAFDKALVHPPPAAVLGALPLIVPRRHTEAVLPLVESLLGALRRHESVASHLLWPVLRCLLGEAGGARRAEGPGKGERAALLLKNHIDTHYSEPLGYPEFCALTRLSRSHLCQLFHRVMGAAPTQYLNRVRLQHACRLLRDARLNISEVGQAVGVGDANYFARLFHREIGQSPSAYQKSVGGRG